MERTARSVYLRLYSTTLLNLVGDAVAQVALPLAFLSLTGSVRLAATLASATLATQLVLTLPLAAMADRLPRRPVVIIGYVVEAVALGALAVLLVTRHPDTTVIVALGCIRGAASQFGVAASAGYVPQVLGRNALLRYNSRVETIEGVAAIAGPSASGGLVGLLGGPLALAVPAVMSLTNAAVYTALPDTPTPTQGTPRTAWQSIGRIGPDIVNGIGYVVRSPMLVSMELIQFALGFTTAGYVYGVIVHLEKGLGLSAPQMGVVLAASGVGGITGSLVLERFIPLTRYKGVLVASLVGVSVVLATFCFAPGPFGAGVALFLLDFCWVGLFIYSGTLSQYVTDDAHLARVDSVSGVVFLAASTLSTLLAGATVGSDDPATYLQLLSLTTLPALVALFTLLPRRGQPAAPVGHQR